jgi:hypothetical protein
MKMRVGMSITVLASWMMAATSGWASTLVSMSLDQLTQASSDIVQAQVINQGSRWNDSHTQVLTITTVGVLQVFKGNASSTLEVEQLGGRVGNMSVFVPGETTLQPQAEYVLFLEPAPATSRFRLVGMTQGAYRIYQDSTTHQNRVILPSLSQLQAQLQWNGAANPPGTLPLEGFHKYVATIVDGGIQIPHGLTLSVAIVSTESRGAGRMHVYGETTNALFPNRNLVIPAGTEVEGEAILVSGMWAIHWDELSVRGVHAPISATNQESEGSLRGRSLILQLR